MKACGHSGDHLGREETLWVKGVFILLVFLSHFSGYPGDDVPGIGLYRRLNGLLGQAIVAPFLFYSGFGVMESLKRKGEEYRKTMLRRRVWGTWRKFALAVVAFAALALILGKEVGLGRFALSLVAWESVGNSNWYIFVILLCYIAAWAAAWVIGTLGRVRPSAGRTGRIAWGMMGLLAMAMIGLYATRPPWWSDTILCFGFGAIYAAYREGVERFAGRFYWPLMALLPAAYWALGHGAWFPRAMGLTGNLRAMAFVLFVVMATMKVRLDFRPLRWCGAALFWIYVYQRLPMIVLSEKFPRLMEGAWAFPGLAVSFAATAAIAAGAMQMKGNGK